MLDLIKSTSGSVIQGALMAATVAVPQTVTVIQKEWQYVSHDSIARTGNQVLTRPDHSRVDSLADMIGSATLIDRESEFTSIRLDWAEDAVRHPAWSAAFRRLEEAGSFEDGWGGEGTLRADRGSLMGAKALVQDLEDAVPADVAPKIGLDSDGTLILSWLRGKLVGTLTVFDAETYGYYLERGGQSAASEETKLSDPLPKELLDILIA